MNNTVFIIETQEVLFIDDISDAVSEGTELALYADDTKIWRGILCDNVSKYFRMI